MDVADSSAWIEFFNGGSNGLRFRPIEDTATLIVPAIVVYEVFKLTLWTRGEEDADMGAAAMRQGRIVASTKDWPVPLQDSGWSMVWQWRI